MIKFTVAPHTADVRLHVEASTQAELFQAALAGMNSILANKPTKKPNAEDVSVEINIESADTTSLLIDFLSEVLTQSYLHDALFDRIDSIAFDGNSVHARLRGYPIRAFCEDIKAVTYHEADVKRNEQDQFETMIVFDI